MTTESKSSVPSSLQPLFSSSDVQTSCVEEENETATMAFDFEEVNGPSPSRPPSMGFQALSGEKPATPKTSKSASKAVSQASKKVSQNVVDDFDDDDMYVSKASSLDASATYEKEEFKKSLFFDREENNRWGDVGKKYELPKAGDVIANYQVESILGQGGFGAVYRVKNLTLGREEALKLILPSAKTDIANIDKRFKREVNCVSRLEHPNIVRLYSSGTLPGGLIWMTMELVGGQTLEKRMQKARLNFFEAKEIMSEVLCGLQEAHSQKLVHRDLKPANIMLDDSKEGYEDLAVILDFGLAKALGDDEDESVQNLTMMEDSKRVYGTPQYMAPEQLQAGIPGPWTDVYAAGLMFVELITGRPAVQGNTPLELAFRQIHTPLALPPRWKGTALEAVIMKATAKNPGERYKNAGEFLDAIKHINAISDPVSVLSKPVARTGTLTGAQSPLATKTASNTLNVTTNDINAGLAMMKAEMDMQKRNQSSSSLFAMICCIGFWVLLAVIVVMLITGILKFG